MALRSAKAERSKSHRKNETVELQIKSNGENLAVCWNIRESCSTRREIDSKNLTGADNPQERLELEKFINFKVVIFFMKFTKQQKKYMELYATTTKEYGFCIGTTANDLQEILNRGKKFQDVFVEYQKIPKDVRESFSQNSDLKGLANRLKKIS